MTSERNTITSTATAIAEQLGETDDVPRRQIGRIVRTLGPERAQAFTAPPRSRWQASSTRSPFTAAHARVSLVNEDVAPTDVFASPVLHQLLIPCAPRSLLTPAILSRTTGSTAPSNSTAASSTSV